MTVDRCDFQVPPAYNEMVRNFDRDRSDSRPLERHRLGGISQTGLLAFDGKYLRPKKRPWPGRARNRIIVHHEIRRASLYRQELAQRASILP
jgi:hypothetical protein